MSTARQYCTFQVGSLMLGFDVLEVQEVLRPGELTPVPLAPESVRGLLNLRGQIVTAIDLRQRLGLAGSPTASAGMVVVVRRGDDVIAFLVDSIGDVLEVESSSFELPPETLAASAQRLIVGVHKLPKQLLHILDASQCAAVAA